jgi:hypothetical protein
MTGLIQPQMAPQRVAGVLAGLTVWRIRLLLFIANERAPAHILTSCIELGKIGHHQVDGIAWDETHTEEDDHRRNEEGGDHQEQSSNNIRLHPIFLF